MNGYIIGIDEAGRGPLAGPVAVGAFAVAGRRVLKRFAGVKDSKQLTPLQLRYAATTPPSAWGALRSIRSATSI
jgi:ribonuclease HII